MTRARFYRFHRLYCLSAPYQEPLTAGRPVYLYTWSLPDPHAVARLTNVEASCFKHVDQTIGLVFSKPITKVGVSWSLPVYCQSLGYFQVLGQLFCCHLIPRLLSCFFFFIETRFDTS
ncbi:unnamed protein product [Dibothriocephalus latus]|uniref:Uncharacterized protein n=1 Tax=Dibothriocephalus latus TaxID=60516 RepID=A0A3P6Q3N2_DIBLA|nr:unnamed protein product [Dibothriocephalus latus]